MIDALLFINLADEAKIIPKIPLNTMDIGVLLKRAMRYFTIRGKFYGVHPDLAAAGVVRIEIDFVKEAIRFVFHEDEPNQGDEDGLTPLHKATIERDLAKCKKFVEEGADPKMVDKDGLSPIYIAQCRKYEEIVMIFKNY